MRARALTVWFGNHERVRSNWNRPDLLRKRLAAACTERPPACFVQPPGVASKSKQASLERSGSSIVTPEIAAAAQPSAALPLSARGSLAATCAVDGRAFLGVVDTGPFLLVAARAASRAALGLLSQGRRPAAWEAGRVE